MRVERMAIFQCAEATRQRSTSIAESSISVRPAWAPVRPTRIAHEPRFFALATLNMLPSKKSPTELSIMKVYRGVTCMIFIPCMIMGLGCVASIDDAGPENISSVEQALNTCTSSCDPPTYDGNPVSCTAQTTCSAYAGYIVCDGMPTYCKKAATRCRIGQMPTCTDTDTSGCDAMCGEGQSGCFQSCCYCFP